MHEPAIFKLLEGSRRVLVAGAGGGSDVYAGLPLAFMLREAGKEVVLANLSFSYLGGTTARRLAPAVACVTATTRGEENYFPEGTLARWLRARGESDVVYAFEKVGVRPLTAAYRALLGAFSVSRTSTAGAAYLDAARDAHEKTPRRPSIVNGSIAAAIAGEFGDVQLTARTQGGELFVNPLMSLYFTFDAIAVARRSLYVQKLASTDTIFEVAHIIEGFRHGVNTRPRRPIPH